MNRLDELAAWARRRGLNPDLTQRDSVLLCLVHRVGIAQEMITADGNPVYARGFQVYVTTSRPFRWPEDDPVPDVLLGAVTTAPITDCRVGAADHGLTALLDDPDGVTSDGS